MAVKVEDKFDQMGFGQLIGNVADSIKVGFKAATSRMIYPSRSHWYDVVMGRNKVDYSKYVGDGRQNAIVAASVNWVARNFPEAPLSLEKKAKGDKPATPMPDHPLPRLVNRPNPYYSGSLLWAGTMADWMFGNAYWRILPNIQGFPVQLWWIPSHLIEPASVGDEFISHYDYKYDPTKEPEKIPVEQIVHFRNGLDPKNPRKGLTQLASLLREIFTDDEAANYTATLLSNMAVPGMIISPGSDNVKVAPEDVDQIKAQAEQKFSNENRGRVMVLSTKATVTTLSFDPQKMNVRELRKLVEERISSVIGIPAIVLGFGAGLDRSTFSNFQEAREAAYESFMIPNQRLIAEELNTQLLPRFEKPPADDLYSCYFDLSGVRVLQTDENEIHTRAQNDFKSNLVMLDEAREMIGLKPLPDGKGQLFAVGMSTTLTPIDELWTEPEPVPAALAAANTPPALAPGRASEEVDLPVEGEQEEDEEVGGSKGAKALVADRTSAQLTKIRNRMEDKASKAIHGFFVKQRNRIIKALKGDKVEAAEIFDIEESDAALRALLTQWYEKTIISVHQMVEGVLDTSFELDDRLTREFLRESGVNIRGISEHTLAQVQNALQAGQELGEGVDELAKRLKDLPAFNLARAKTVARTELGNSANTAALYVYEASNLVFGVHIFDGEEHPPCKEVNGKIISLQEARTFPKLGHPNCVRAFGAVTDRESV